jgi:hypothetical protein
VISRVEINAFIVPRLRTSLVMTRVSTPQRPGMRRSRSHSSIVMTERAFDGSRAISMHTNPKA